MSGYRKFAGCAVLVSVLLAGCDGPTSQNADPTSPATSGTASLGTSTPTPTTAPPASPAPPAPAKVVLPDASARRLIQAGDTAQSAAREALSSDRQLRMVTLPCATAAPASDALVVDRNAMNMSFSLNAQPIFQTVSESLTSYRPGGAAQYLSELNAALTRCPTDRVTTFTVAARSFAGDESVLILNTFQNGSSYRAVIRAGDVVMVLDVQPLESGQTERATADTMIDVALKRAAT